MEHLEGSGHYKVKGGNSSVTKKPKGEKNIVIKISLCYFLTRGTTIKKKKKRKEED